MSFRDRGAAWRVPDRTGQLWAWNGTTVVLVVGSPEQPIGPWDQGSHPVVVLAGAFSMRGPLAAWVERPDDLWEADERARRVL